MNSTEADYRLDAASLRRNRVTLEGRVMSAPQGLKRAPYTGAYPEGGTEWIDVFGYATPVTWGDPGAEYDAVRCRAAFRNACESVSSRSPAA